MAKEKKARDRRLFRWEMWGILFITLMGGLLHFTFELSGDWLPLGVVSAVNESVWEHLKLAFWPAFFWTIIEYIFLRPTIGISPNFWLARAIGTLIMPVIIVVNFYSYTAFTGESLLAVDLSSFVIAIAVGQSAGYQILHRLDWPRPINWIGIVLFVIGILLFAVFTFYPPQAGIFRDPVSGRFGVF
jgi:hypothetical protein